MVCCLVFWIEIMIGIVVIVLLSIVGGGGLIIVMMFILMDYGFLRIGMIYGF